MYKPSIQLVLPYGPSTWGQHLCQSLFSRIFISWDVQRFVVMCSEYCMRTDLGHNLTRMERCTAISEYSNFPDTFFENLHPHWSWNLFIEQTILLMMKPISNTTILCILVTPKNCRYMRLYFVLGFSCTA